MRRRSFFQLTDRGNGEIDLFWVRVEGDAMRPRAFPRSMPFDNPVTDDDRKDVRWYLEHLLTRPLAPERSRARAIEERLQLLGAALFEQVFRAYDEGGVDPRAFYGEAAEAGLAESELRVVSDDPAFLNIPWELMFETSGGFLGQQFGGIVRHPVDPASAVYPELAEGPPLDPSAPFRILLVTARPHGPSDYQLRTLVRSLPRAVRAAWPRIQVEVLRPPSFAELQRRLAEQPGSFQFVHIDGHAVGSTRQVTFTLPAEDDGRRRRRADDQETIGEVRAVQEGRLIFETADGRPDTAPADALAAALVRSRARLVVLSAPTSAAESGESPHALVASQLVRAGVPGVVTLPYSLDATAAERFLGPLYTRILEGDSLTEAVAEGRRALSAERRRASLFGPLPLQDWFVPRLYQHTGVLQPVRAADDPMTTDIVPEAPAGRGVTELDVKVRQHVGEVCRPVRYGLVGRDGDLLRLDAALSNPDRPWALLSGSGGSGKSALASEFGRWYYETGGCPGGVFVTSFESRADFGQVLGSVVTRREDFWRYSPEERVERLLDYLRATPCLLILDHLETVAGYPVGAPPLATERDRRDLGRFLQALRGGKTRVLMTSRKTDEIWLGVSYVELSLEGLASQSAGILAAQILRTVGKNPNEYVADRDYGRLLELLQGHPRAMEVSLPQLHWLSPGDLLDALKRAAAGAPTMLDGYQSFAFDQLSPTTQRHLPATGLFSGILNADVGSTLFGQADPRPDGYRAIVGESPDRAGWRAILAEAAAAGLVRDLGRGRYQIPSTLTPILRRRLTVQVGEDGVRRLDRELVSFFSDLCGRLAEGVRRGDANALALLTFETPNLVRALRSAATTSEWARVFPIARVLSDLSDAQGRYDEWARLRDALLGRMGSSVAPEGDGGDLWRFLTTSQAREAMRRRDYAEAETIYRRLLAHFQAWKSPRAEPAVATTFGQLGRVSEERAAWDEAELWYRQALEIREHRGQTREAATVAQQLGAVVAAQGRFEDAEASYVQALDRFKDLGLDREAATTMQRLGQLALNRRRLGEADTWLQQAVVVLERLELPREAAAIMQSLGAVAYERERLDEAEEWYGKALALYEQLGDDAAVATTVFALGTVVVAAQRTEPAEQLLIRAVELARNGEQHPLHLDALLALARVEETRRDQTSMVRNLGQALYLATDTQPLRRRQVVAELARVLPSVGEDRLRGIWQALFDGENPPLDEIIQVQLHQAS